MFEKKFLIELKVIVVPPFCITLERILEAASPRQKDNVGITNIIKTSNMLIQINANACWGLQVYNRRHTINVRKSPAKLNSEILTK